MSAFEELGVMPSIIETLTAQDWLLPRPVQTEAIPLILGGGDVAVAAETGAGKTGAFCIPILQIVFETLQSDDKAFSPVLDPLTPTGFSSVDRSRSIAVDGNAVQSRLSGAWQGVRASRPVARGKWYYMVRPHDEGLCRVGWSGAHASLNLGTDKYGFGYGGTGMKSNRAKFDPYGEKYGLGDVVTCLLAFDSSDGSATISFLLNGKDLGPAFRSIPPTELPAHGLYPTISLKNAEVVVDFSELDPVAEQMGFQSLALALVEDGTPEITVLAENEAKTNLEMQSPSERRLPLALILEPSRELAEQVHVELEKLAPCLEATSIQHILLVGGGNTKEDARKLRGDVDIVSGTLGCVTKHLEDHTLSLANVRFFVLDEADTFASNSLNEVVKLHENIPLRNQVQTLLFSATLHSPEIIDLSAKLQKFPTWIDLKGKEAVPETVHHTLLRLDADADIGLVGQLEAQIRSIEPNFAWPLDDVHVPGGSSMDAADERSLAMKRIKLASLKKVIDSNCMDHAMLFVRTQVDADNLERFLLFCSGIKRADHDSARFRGSRESGPQVDYSCAVLHAGRRPDERRSALAAFRNGEVRFLICTDVAARGIDVTGIPYLVNVTLPDKSENYIHRVGRVGRSDHMGLAVSLVSSQKEAVWYHTCNRSKSGSCKNRQLVDVGGCVIWYNEPKILDEIEQRLGGKIEELDDFKRKREAGAPPTMYGSMKQDAELGSTTAAHIESLKPAVRELVRLEEDVQQCYFDLQARHFGSFLTQ